MKNAIYCIINRYNQAEENIFEVEDRWLEIIQPEKKKEKRMKKDEESLKDLLDTIKRAHLLIMRVPEEEIEK